MNILVVNAGSSSLKYQLIDTDSEKMLTKGCIERIGIEGTKIKHEKGDVEKEYSKPLQNHTQAFEEVCALLTDKEVGVLNSLDEINAVGHRVLHAAEDFTGSVLITDEVIATLKKNQDLGPLHMPANIACIESAKKVLPDVPMVSVFDTAFHATMPRKAFMYAIDYTDYEKYKVRRYGFHGTSHKYVTGEAIKMLGTENSKIITCHLGNGSSISAVKDGKCQDTSMGLTPLEGLVMGTRSGDLDAACLEFLMSKTGMNISEMTDYLNKKSGLLGISGVSSDNRDILKAAREGNARAQLAFDMTTYRIRKYIGSYTAVLEGLDAIVFTGGIGENDVSTRKAVLDGLSYMGVKYDEKLNANLPGGNQVLSTEDSKVKVFVIPTNEELVIARETRELVE